MVKFHSIPLYAYLQAIQQGDRTNAPLTSTYGRIEFVVFLSNQSCYSFFFFFFDNNKNFISEKKKEQMTNQNIATTIEKEPTPKQG